MKRTLLCAAALLSMSSLSFAADLPSRAMAIAPVYLAPAFTWTGFYVGGNVGAAWGGKSNCPTINSLANGVYTPNTEFLPNCNGNGNTGVIGGIQAGYNWQFGGWLFGLEGDVNWIGRNNDHGYDYAVFGSPALGNMPAGNDNRGRPSTSVTNHVYSWTGDGNANTLSTIRARFGFTTDRTLFFVTGGAAFRNGDNNASLTDTAVTITTSSSGVSSTSTPIVRTYNRSGNGDNVGWALGGGLEYALTENLSTKIEYLHAQFGNGGNTYTNPDTIDRQAFLGDHKNAIDIVRVGLNYRFASAAPAPVLARY
jgi:outer membrane immunogenic protein